MIPIGIGIALSVRLGSILPTSVKRAKTLLFWCYVVNMGIMALISAAVYVYRETLFRMFTSDTEVLEVRCTYTYAKRRCSRFSLTTIAFILAIKYSSTHKIDSCQL